MVYSGLLFFFFFFFLCDTKLNQNCKMNDCENRMASEESHDAVTTDHSVEPKRSIMTPMVIAKVKLCTRTSAKMIYAEEGKKHCA